MDRLTGAVPYRSRTFLVLDRITSPALGAVAGTVDGLVAIVGAVVVVGGMSPVTGMDRTGGSATAGGVVGVGTVVGAGDWAGVAALGETEALTAAISLVKRRSVAASFM